MSEVRNEAAGRLRIDVVSDVVCPWCYLGKRRLAAALALVPEIHTEIGWRPFRLDPTIPPEGIPRREYLEGKFGSLEAVADSHDRLIVLGNEEGIDFRFAAITRSPNTIDAHRLVRWAEPGEMQERMVERLFRSYFTEGGDVGDRQVLAALAVEAGLGSDAGARLETDEDRDAVEAEIAQAYRIGVTGVPCFIIDHRYAVLGAEAPETLARALVEIESERMAPK